MESHPPCPRPDMHPIRTRSVCLSARTERVRVGKTAGVIPCIYIWTITHLKRVRNASVMCCRPNKFMKSHPTCYRPALELYTRSSPETKILSIFLNHKIMSSIKLYLHKSFLCFSHHLISAYPGLTILKSISTENLQRY